MSTASTAPEALSVNHVDDGEVEQVCPNSAESGGSANHVDDGEKGDALTEAASLAVRKVEHVEYEQKRRQMGRGSCSWDHSTRVDGSK